MGESKQAGDEWYQSAVLYELDVKNFQDSNGDGVGDFPGLTSRLDYLVDLGIDAIWIQPFYPSPDRDNGYDVTDYCAVDPRLGTLAEFDAFVAAARSRGIRLIADLPLNHTSNEHPWFKRSREGDPEFRDYYVWRDQPPKNRAPYPIFGPEPGGNWRRDDVAERFYFHTFYRFMPDLNFGNPRVREELLDVARFWLDRGIDGFRLDAVPYFEQFTSEQEHYDHPHEFLKQLRAAVVERRPDAVLIAEANLKPAEMRPYFGDGDEMTLLLNFYLCNHIFLAMATERAEPISRSWGELPKIPGVCNWANFLRNHDELSLDQLSKREQAKVLDKYAPEADMRLYDRGIRRRLAKMLDGDQQKLRLIYSLLLSLPGTPVINLGEELGLGDDLALNDREAGRTPMQWNAHDPNGGWTTARRELQRRPVVDQGDFAFQYLNVEDQRADPNSLLNFFRAAIRAYKETPAFGRGEWSFPKSGHKSVLIHRADWHGSHAVALHNLGPKHQKVDVELPESPTQTLADGEYDPPRDGQVELRPYGYRWFRSEG